MFLKPVEFIQRNLHLFCLDDVRVSAKVRITRHGVLLRTEDYGGLLSAICARHRQVLTEVPHDLQKWEKANVGFSIYKGSDLLGTVNDRGHFYYTQACDVGVALGWLMATSLGREKELANYRPVKCTEAIRGAIINGSLTESLLSNVLLLDRGNKDINLGYARDMFLEVARRK